AYLWCRCGRSEKQPYCDGSHRGTSFTPVRYVATEDGEEVLFCGCKRTCHQPFCDGTHNNLKSTYDEDDPTSEENRAIPQVVPSPDGKARLDGSCFVCYIPALPLQERGTVKFAPVISSADGAVYQSQFYLEIAPGDSPVIGFGDRHVVLLATAGRGGITISGRDFEIGPNQGVYIRPREAFRLRSEEPEGVRVFAAVCPQADGPVWPAEAPDNFDAAHRRRVVGIDPSQRQSMADRFFQLLVDKRMGSDVVTQFIGEIPISKAMPHRHLYEESLVILKGKGFMWTESKKAPVEAGDVIFLPRKQVHSLECTDPGGMMVAGVIYPGDNPSINY
ncbi:MAG: CDGSH iron-sulfur domain-containing protein, partial [Acidobacteriota bacterium]